MASMPAMKKLLTEARAHGVMVVYSVAGKATAANILPDIAPAAGDPVVHSSVDKFYKTDLEKILKDKGIKGVIAVGTLAYGGVLHTAGQAALRGFKVVVPLDGMSSLNEDTLYTEQYTAWHLANAPFFGGRITVTKTDMIKF